MAQLDVDVPAPIHSMLDVDSNYIKIYRYQITSRLYASRKYTAYTLPGVDNKPYLFRPNNTFNLGIGWTYRGFTLNLGYGFPFVNGDGSQRGKTKNLDLQMHMYGRKQIIDVYGQLYKGFYSNPGLIENHQGYYAHPNNDLLSIGFNYIRVLNYKKFSLRNGANHDERQLKSAGSFLYGVEAMFNRIKNNNGTIVPQGFDALSHYQNIDRIITFNIGPNIGYGYNWVPINNIFIGAAATLGTTFSYYQSAGNENVSFHTFKYGGAQGLLYIAPTTAIRLSAGYNADKWGLIGYYVHQTTTSYAQSDRLMSNSVGNFRVNFVYRFQPNKTVSKVLKPYEWFFK